jgi:hypothetical protein
MNNYINRNIVIKDEFYSKNQDFLLCKLCQDILIEPMKCSNCNNLFCKKCIDDWMTTNGKCPNNCKNSKYNESIFINDILLQITFNCLFCTETIRYNQIKDHYLDKHNNKISSHYLHNFNNPVTVKLNKETHIKKSNEIFDFRSKRKK